MAERENISRVVWELAWPAVALNSLQVVNSLLDRFFIGSLPKSALTAHSSVLPVLFFFVSISFAVGIASTALVSRAYGAGDAKEYRLSNRKCLSLALYLGLLLAVVMWPASSLMGNFLTPAEDLAARSQFTEYMSIFVFGLPAYFLIQTQAGSLRGIGDTKSPMVISGIQILLHILLNFLLIFPARETAIGLVVPGADLGLKGAALAITISAWTSALIYLWWSGKTPLGISWRLRPPEWHWQKRILRIAVPASMMRVVRTTSLMAFYAVLSRVPEGSSAVAAVGVGFSIESLAFMPTFGLAIAASALVGQSLGMKNPGRAERIGYNAAHWGALVSGVASIGLFVFAPQAAALIIPSQVEVQPFVVGFLRYICATEILFSYAMVLMGGMQGAGDTMRPFWISFVSLWVVRLPMAWVLAISMGMGADGCWTAMMVSQAIQGLAALWLFKQGAWKRKEV